MSLPPEAPLYGSPRPGCTVFAYWCAYWWSTVATAVRGRCSMGRCSRGNLTVVGGGADPHSLVPQKLSCSPSPHPSPLAQRAGLAPGQACTSVPGGGGRGRGSRAPPPRLPDCLKWPQQRKLEMSQQARALSLQTVISKATTTGSLWTQPEAEGVPRP